MILLIIVRGRTVKNDKFTRGHLQIVTEMSISGALSPLCPKTCKMLPVTIIFSITYVKMFSKHIISLIPPSNPKILLLFIFYIIFILTLLILSLFSSGTVYCVLEFNMYPRLDLSTRHSQGLGLLTWATTLRLLFFPYCTLFLP